MQCDSRPNCGCPFCVQTRTGESPKDEQDRIAVEYMHDLEKRAARIRAQRIRGHAQSKRRLPIVHRHHGQLCSGCYFDKKRESD